MDERFTDGQDRSPWEQEGLPSLDLTAQKVRPRRRFRLGTGLTIILSGVAGAAVGAMLFSGSSAPPAPPAQTLVGSGEIERPPVQSLAQASEESEPERTTERSRSKDRPRKAGSKHDRIVISAPSGGGSAAPAPAAPAPAQPKPERERKKKPETHSGSQQVVIANPTTPLYHLYRKRDRWHRYATNETDANAMKAQDGYKDRASPGFVFLKPKDHTVAVEVPTYYGPLTVYIYAEDRDDDTVPLYRLTGKAGRVMYTSWPVIRDAWVEKGWTLQGVVGYIFRPS